MFGAPELWWWGALANLLIWFDLIWFEGCSDRPGYWLHERLSSAASHLLHRRVRRSLLRTALPHGSHLQPCNVIVSHRRDITKSSSWRHDVVTLTSRRHQLTRDVTYSLVVWKVWSRQRPGEHTTSGLRMENKLRKQVSSRICSWVRRYK